MPIIGFHRQEVGVVQNHFVALFQEGQVFLGIHRLEGDILAVEDFHQLIAVAGVGPVYFHQVGSHADRSGRFFQLHGGRPVHPLGGPGIGPGSVGGTFISLGRHGYQAQLGGFQGGDYFPDAGAQLDAAPNQGRGGLCSGIAGRLPEVVAEIGGVHPYHGPVQQPVAVRVQLSPGTPGLDGKAHPGGVGEHFPLLCGKAFVGIAAAAGAHGIDHSVQFVSQHAERPHPDGEHVGHGLRGAHHEGNGSVPDLGGFRSAGGTESAAAAAVAVATGALTVIEQLRQIAGEFRAGGTGPVRADGGFRAGGLVGGVEHAALVALQEIGPVVDAEHDGIDLEAESRGRPLIFRAGGDVLEEPSPEVFFLQGEIGAEARPVRKTAVHQPALDGLIDNAVFIDIGAGEGCVGTHKSLVLPFQVLPGGIAGNGQKADGEEDKKSFHNRSISK